MTKPLIGISSAVSYDKHNWKFLRAYALNVSAVEEAGGIPVLVPSGLQPDNLRALYERLDGVLLPGGGDIDPSNYNRPPSPELKMVDHERDGYEIELARWAVADELPVFGICRGHQIFNVALGGTLVQDIPSAIDTPLKHDIEHNDMPRSLRLHDVEISENSLLARVMGGTRFSVNSLHHQSIDELAPNLVATAHAPDGIIEATEIEGHPFALTVQWHPEDMVADDEAMRRLFKAFVDAAAKRRG
ncbi:MAG: gamma-glutamyl-gamma-aminobutyrate hydrolase family protein [Chloroflexota bacterium]